MTDEEGPGRPPTDPSPTMMMIGTTDSTDEPADEGLERDQPRSRIPPSVLLEPIGPDPEARRVTAIAPRPWAIPRSMRQPARSRGLTGRRNRRTRRCRPSSRPPDEPSRRRTHRENQAEGTEGAGMTNDLDALKARTNLVETVRGDVKLKRGGADEHWGCCPFHREKTPSFKVSARRQEYHCFGCGAHGDIIDYLVQHDGLSTGEAIRRLHELADATSPATAPSRRPGRRPPAEVPPDLVLDPEVERRRALAQETWRQTETIADGLPFDYLTRRRGIAVWDCDRVRWHPRCPWKGGIAGCILVPITDHATGYVVGIWRIRPAMRGPIERRGLGSSKGNAARLFDAPGPELIVTEGVEDALAAHALFGAPAWAALSATGMAGLILPARFRRILIVPDNDPPGLDAAQRLARRLVSEGRRVEIQKPKSAKDANDVLTGGESAA
jgi:DNA primase